MTTNPFLEIFQKKYNEFVTDLKATIPEMDAIIDKAYKLSSTDRMSQFTEFVLPACDPSRDSAQTPGFVLPGVKLSQDLWSSLSNNSQNAIQEYLRILSFCCMYENSKSEDGKMPKMNEWTETFLNSWKEKLGDMDFDSLSKKIAEMISGMGPSAFPKMPERLLKGHLAKLAEELIREFKPEDFGLTAEELEACDSHPARAFELLTEVYTKKPELLQKAIERIAHRLQEKIKRGELRPEQIAAEAEELMKEFTENSSFTELMKNFKGIFSMQDPEVARRAGRPEEARMNIVKERLRKKLEAKQNAKK
jgi:hypothetical protein